MTELRLKAVVQVFRASGRSRPKGAGRDFGKQPSTAPRNNCEAAVQFPAVLSLPDRQL